MSLNEYNKHSIMGPFAGPATSISAIAGQEAYKRAHEQPTYVSSGNEKPLTISGTLLMLAAFAIGAALGIAGVFILPESMSGIAGFIALLCLIAIAIICVFAGTEAVKFAVNWLFASAIEDQWWWIGGVALAAFIFAAVYSFVLEPAETWMVILFATALAFAGRFVSRLRSACAALGTGVVVYAVAAEHFFTRYGFLAISSGLIAAALVFGLGYGWKALRRRGTA